MMRQLSWIPIAVLALLVSAAAAPAQTSAPTIAVTLTQSAMAVNPGQNVTLTASATGYQVRTELTFAWEASGGGFGRRSSATANPNEAVWRAPTTPGDYQVVVAVSARSLDSPVRRIAMVQVRRAGQITGPTPTLDVIATPLSIRADGKSRAQIVATYTGAPPLAGRPVRFYTTLGSIPPTATTGADGRATVSLTSTTEPGIAFVTASVGNQTASVQVAIGATQGHGVRPGYPIYVYPAATTTPLAVYANPASIPADGRSVAVITAVVLNDFDQPVDQRAVYFSTTGGSIGPWERTNRYGRAAVYLGATTQPGSVTVTATSQGRSGSLNVNFNPLVVQVRAGTFVKQPDGSNACEVQAWVGDALGQAAANGTPVYFSASQGAVTPNAVTRNGYTSGVLVLPEGVNSTTVVARALESTAEMRVRVPAPVALPTPAPTPPPTTPTPPANTATSRLYLAADPMAIPADGASASRVTAILLDAAGTPMANTAIFFTASSGAIDPSATTDAGGRATVSLTAGTTPATVLITAQGDGAVAVIQVEFREKMVP